MNLIGCERLRFIQMLTDSEQEKHQTSSGLFEVLREKLKPQHNETILSQQYCKLIREEKESPEEWMGHLRVKANECECKDRDKRLKEQFIINDDEMMTEIIKELAIIKKTNEIIGVSVMHWVKKVDVQRVQKANWIYIKKAENLV